MQDMFLSCQLALLKDKEASIRRESIIAITKHGDFSSEELFPMLQSDDDDVKIYAIWELATREDGESIPALQQLLENSSEMVKLYALWALIVLGTEEKTLLSACYEKWPKVRELAVWALLENGITSAEAIAAIVHVANSPQVDTITVTAAIAKLHLEKLEQWSALLAIVEPSLRQRALDNIEAMSTRQDFLAIAPALVAILESPERQWWQQARKILDRVAPELAEIESMANDGDLRARKVLRFLCTYPPIAQKESHLRREVEAIRCLLFTKIEAEEEWRDDDIIEFIRSQVSVSERNKAAPAENYFPTALPDQSPIAIVPDIVNDPEPLLEKCRRRELEFWRQEQLRRGAIAMSWPHTTPCCSCKNDLEFASKGNYRCPFCGSYITVDEYGIQLVMTTVNLQMLDLTIPCNAGFIAATQAMVRSLAQQVSFSENICSDIDEAMAIVLTIMAEKATDDREKLQLMAVANDTEMIVAINSLRPFLQAGGPRDARLPQVARKVDRLEVFPLPNGGQMLKMTKRRRG